jgi:hypothetical protein
MPFWRRKRRDDDDDEVVGYSIPGYASPPIPEDKLDMATIALAFGDLTLAARETTTVQREAFEKMRAEAKVEIEGLLAKGVKHAEPGSAREAKLRSLVAQWKRRMREAREQDGYC